MMRAYAAVTTFRTVTRETEFKGVKMMPGDKVAMSTAITSRDPEAWTNPNEVDFNRKPGHRSEEHTSELQSLMRISYAVFCLKKKLYIYFRLYNRFFISINLSYIFYFSFY